MLVSKADITLYFCTINIQTKTVNTSKFLVFIIATCFDPRRSTSWVVIPANQRLTTKLLRRLYNEYNK